MTHRTIALAGLAVLALLAACATPLSPAQSLVTACQSADAALRVALAANGQHQLTAAQIRAVTLAGTVINGFCAAPVPPADVPKALVAVAQAVSDLSTQVH